MTSSSSNTGDQKPIVTYRPFVADDFEAAARLFQNQWCTEISDEAGRIASQADLCGYLEQVNWGIVAEKPQVSGTAAQLLGVALLSINGQPCPWHRPGPSGEKPFLPRRRRTPLF